MKTPLEKLIDETLNERTPAELALGWLRYETLRRFSLAKHSEMYHRNIKGEFYDKMIDEELLKWKETK